MAPDSFPPNLDLLGAVAAAEAKLAGAAHFHIDAVSRELGLDPEAYRNNTGFGVRALVRRGFVRVPSAGTVDGVDYPIYVTGLTAAGRRNLPVQAK